MRCATVRGAEVEVTTEAIRVAAARKGAVGTAAAARVVEV